MHRAIFHRVARPLATMVGSQASYSYRITLALLVIGGTLGAVMPERAFAQSETGVLNAPLIAPAHTIPGEAIPVDNVTGGQVQEIIHEIMVGDTLSAVAKRYAVEPANLAAYNQILDFNHVIIGQKLRIPPRGVEISEPAAILAEVLPGADGYHVMRMGDSLGAISRKYNIPVDVLMAINDITEPNLVPMGKMLRLTADVELPAPSTVPEDEFISYEVQRGDTLAEIAEAYHTTITQLRFDNEFLDAHDADLIRGQTLRIWPPADAAEAFGVDAPVGGERKIVIDLSEQTLTAYQGGVKLLQSIVSTGKAATPTRPGEFATYLKYKSQHMYGDDYDLPGVPWVMYYDDEYAVHGAYWHANFGTPTSHGCTNMSIPESKALYSWAPLGTKVIVIE